MEPDIGPFWYKQFFVFAVGWGVNLTSSDVTSKKQISALHGGKGNCVQVILANNEGENPHILE